MSRAWLSITLVILVACSPRGAITYVPDAAQVGDVTPVFIGTTRVLESLGVVPVEEEVQRLNLLDCRLIERESA